MMNMTARDLAVLATEQYKALTKCRAEWDGAFTALRTIVGVIEQGRICPPDYLDTVQKILAIAKGALEEADE